MNRSDYTFRPLSSAQYEAIVSASEMDGRTSPMHGQANCDGLIRESQALDIDPRIALAWTLWEDHDGTDPNGGVALAKVYNFAGIKWAGQSYAYDSGIACPANEGGTYAGFRDFGGFARALYLTLTNRYCGPSFNAGKLVDAASMYIAGKLNSGRGQERVDTFLQYQSTYPPGADNAPQGVYGEDIITLVRGMVGQPNSTADFDRLNGVHPWAYYCEALAEAAPRALGLSEVARASAVAKLAAAHAQGIVHTDTPPEHGAWVFFDTAFYAPDGHIAFWDADLGQVLGTVTDGTGIGYRHWGPQTTGYAGWCRVPGVVGARRSASPDISHPVMEQNLVLPGNPFNRGVKNDPRRRIGIGGGFLKRYRETPNATAVFGWPMENERQALVTTDGVTKQMTIQRFERATMLFDPHAPPPWDVVVALATQKITPLRARRATAHG